MLCVPTASGLGVAHTLAARSLLLQTLSRAPVQSDVCYSLHAAEDLLHLPRMLHIPSAFGGRLQRCCAAALAHATSDLSGLN